MMAHSKIMCRLLFDLKWKKCVERKVLVFELNKKEKATTGQR